MDTTKAKEYIIKSIALEKLLPSDQDLVIKKLEKKVEEKSFTAILNALNENERKELLALSENGSTTVVHNFIEEHVPNVKEIIEKAAKEIVEDFKKKI